MRRRLFIRTLAVLPALTFLGCSTFSSVDAERGRGVAHSYAVPYEELWAALPALLGEMGVAVRERSEPEGVGILRVEGGSMGDSATIFVDRIGTRGYTRVEVVLERTLGMTLSFSDLDKDIHKRLALRFRQL